MATHRHQSRFRTRASGSRARIRHQEKYDLAIAAYRQAAPLRSQLPEIHLAMGSDLAGMKKLDDALGEVQLELKLVPESKARIGLQNRGLRPRSLLNALAIALFCV